MNRMRISLFAAAFAFSTSGCFQIEQAVDLQKDLSGTAEVKIGIDFEPMITIMAQMQREMSGKTGSVTKEELAAAKADFKKQAKSQPPDDPKVARREAEKSLPEGIKLLDLHVDQTDFSVLSDFKFAFDKLSRLADLRLPSSKDSSDPTKKNVIDAPFGGLIVAENGNTLTITTKPENPTSNVEQEARSSAKIDPETEKMMKDAFKNLRVAYRITAPFQVISHNATRREGNTLIWEYDMASFEKMSTSKKADDLGVKVTYRR